MVILILGCALVARVVYPKVNNMYSQLEMYFLFWILFFDKQ